MDASVWMKSSLAFRINARATQGADDAGCHGMLRRPKGLPMADDEVAYAQLGGVPQRKIDQVVGVGPLSTAISEPASEPTTFCVKTTVVQQRDRDFIGVLHHIDGW